MKTLTNTKKDKKNKLPPVLPVCTENKYIENHKIREELGLTSKAKILME